MCTTVAIAIVAETCAPFTVLPALMNEYRVPELNVQNGVLKALSFMFEYIGEMGKDYIYAVTPLLQARAAGCCLLRLLLCRILRGAVLPGTWATWGGRGALLHCTCMQTCVLALGTLWVLPRMCPNSHTDHLPCILQTCAPQDALMDRDLVHRQTAASVVQHLSLGAAGLGCEDALRHLLNFVWPNIFETSPHIVAAVSGAIDGCRLALGPCVVLQYTLQVRRAAKGCCALRVFGVCVTEQALTHWNDVPCVLIVFIHHVLLLCTLTLTS